MNIVDFLPVASVVLSIALWVAFRQWRFRRGWTVRGDAMETLGTVVVTSLIFGYGVSLIGIFALLPLGIGQAIAASTVASQARSRKIEVGIALSVALSTITTTTWLGLMAQDFQPSLSFALTLWAILTITGLLASAPGIIFSATLQDARRNKT